MCSSATTASTPWWFVLVENVGEIEQKIVEDGCDPRIPDSKGHTLLHVAATTDDVNLLRLGLKHIDVETRDQLGMTALHLSAAGDNVDCLQGLETSNSSQNLH